MPVGYLSSVKCVMIVDQISCSRRAMVSTIAHLARTAHSTGIRFSPTMWSGGGYLAIDKSVGSLIDWVSGSASMSPFIHPSWSFG